jgi:endonuclease YncB( thermonuclease family)
MKKALIKTLLFIFILTLLSSPLHAQELSTVIKLIDGDTLWVHYEGQRERVRLIPESRINMKAKKDAEKLDRT